MQRYGFGIIVAILPFSGCQPEPSQGTLKNNNGKPPEATRAFQADLLDGLVLKDKPGDFNTVADVRGMRKDGDRVTIKGKVPPATVFAFKQTLAEVKIMDEEMLESSAVKEE